MLFELILRPRLHRLAGDEVFVRGQDYFTDKRVANLRATRNKVTASVIGTQAYDVALRDVSGRLQHSCTCPHSADGNFCKHAVALGLAWLADPAAREQGGSRMRSWWLEAREALDKRSREDLTEMLIAAAQRSTGVLDQILVQVRYAETPGGRPAWLRKKITGITAKQVATGDYQRGYDMADDMSSILAWMAEMQQPDAAMDLMDLCEYAINRLARAAGANTCTEAWKHPLYSAYTRLSHMHRQAWQMTGMPSTAAKARWLVWAESDALPGGGQFGAAAYREVLGAQGLQSYLAETEKVLKVITGRELRAAPDICRARTLQDMRDSASAELQRC